MRIEPKSRNDFRHFHIITTRWMDNDAYGHVNNVVYYSWFDTAVNSFLVRNSMLDSELNPVLGLVVETQCNYLASVAFPEDIEVGMIVSSIGNSSVRYELGIFRLGDETACARGHFVHVYVDRKSRRPVSLPGAMRALLESIAAKNGR